MIKYLGYSCGLVHSGCKIARFHFDVEITDGVEFNLSIDDDLHREELDDKYVTGLKGWIDKHDVYMKFNPYYADRLLLLEAYIADDEEEQDD